MTADQLLGGDRGVLEGLRRYAVPAVACLGVLLSAPVLTGAAEQEDLLTGYSVTTWNEGDGRPFGAVNAIVQDRRGYLWIGADSGLFRFDGSRFTTADDINDAPLPKRAVTALCLGGDGTLWVGFADDSSMRRIRDGHVEVLPRTNAPVSVSDIAEDSDGVMWVVGDGILSRLDATGWRKVTLTAGGRDARVRQVYRRRNGELVVATWLGIFKLNDRAERFDRVSTNVSWGVTEDARGRIWTTDIAHGYRRIDEPASARRSGAGYRVMFDRDGHLWVATYGAGLWRVSVDERADRRPTYRAGLRTGLSSDAIQVLLEDRDGNIWVGTSGGLHRLTRRRLTPLEDVGYALAVEPDVHGGMWVGTSTGVLRVPGNAERWGQALSVSKRPNVRSLYDDRRGTLWVGATDGLFRIVAGRLTPIPLPLDPQPQIATISPAPNGALWLTDGAALLLWDGRRLLPFDFAPHTALGRVTAASADRAGRLWVGFESGRLGSISGDGTFHLLGPTENYEARSSDAVHAVFEDDDGNVWVGSGRGLGRVKGGRFEPIGRHHGLRSGPIWSITIDSRHRLWLSVDGGLICVDRREFDNALETPGYRVQYRLYDTLDGLAGRPFGHISSSRADNGTLWFIRGGGLTRVGAEQAPEDFASIVAPLFIESVQTANQRVPSPAQEIAFSHRTGRLQINYAAVVLSAPNKIRFRYRLAGVDPDWVDAGTQRVAFYTNLSPGGYRFQVEASAEEGIWNTSKAELSFTIQPAFYQTGWFYAICLAGALTGVWAIWRFRMGLVKREFALVLAERLRLSRELHDTLLQSLVGVVLQLEPIAQRVVQEPRVARHQLIRVRRQVEAYVREARESIKNLRSPSLKARGLATALEEFGRDAAAHTSATFRLEVTGTLDLPPDVEGELFRIGQEAITNAVRHAGATHIGVVLRVADGFVSLRVSDDGCGFRYDPHAVPDDHYGLLTMRERAEELHGVLDISTAAGQGAVLEVTVPMAPTVRCAIGG